jgi:hypothetical protein
VAIDAAAATRLTSLKQGEETVRTIFIVGLALASVGCAKVAGGSANSPATNAIAVQPDYHPSLGDLMTMAVQPRHIKLGMAGKARNWEYAAYETSELKNAFARVQRTVPSYRKTEMKPLIDGSVKDPIDALDAAVKAKDAAKFDVAYADLTKACNTCHQQLDHTFVVIKAPDASPYADQTLTPAKAP